MVSYLAQEERDKQRENESTLFSFLSYFPIQNIEYKE